MKIDISNISFDDANLHKKYDQSFITRYIMVASIVKEMKKNLKINRPLHILDLGGYNGAARQLLQQDRVTILDVFPDEKLEDYIRVDSVGIPRDDNSFDIVISTDVVEHIPPEYRDTFLNDAIRVAKIATIIAAPFEHDTYEVAQEEMIANTLYQGATGEEYCWLKEHHDYGLPSRSWIESRLRNDTNLSFGRFSHSSLRLWGELISSGFFVANNVAAVDRNMARQLKALNREYFRSIAKIDFPENGYRTYYVISKEIKDISIRVPVYDKQAVDTFTKKARITLGKMIASLSRMMYEYREDVKRHVEQDEHNYAEIERLRQFENWYNKLAAKAPVKIYKYLKRNLSREDTKSDNI